MAHRKARARGGVTSTSGIPLLGDATEKGRRRLKLAKQLGIKVR